MQFQQFFASVYHLHLDCNLQVTMDLLNHKTVNHSVKTVLDNMMRITYQELEMILNVHITTSVSQPSAPEPTHLITQTEVRSI